MPAWQRPTFPMSPLATGMMFASSHHELKRLNTAGVAGFFTLDMPSDLSGMDGVVSVRRTLVLPNRFGTTNREKPVLAPVYD